MYMYETIMYMHVHVWCVMLAKRHHQCVCVLRYIRAVLRGEYREKIGRPAKPNVQYLIQEEPASAASVTSVTSLTASLIMLVVAVFLHF